MRKAELIKDPPVKIRKRKGVVYAGRRFEACGETVIETNIYVDGTLEVRHFTYRSGWQTYNVLNDSWDQSTLEWVAFGGHPYYYGSSRLYCQIEDKTYAELRDDRHVRTYDMVTSMEWTTKSDRQTKAYERKQMRIDNEMHELTPELPKDLNKFIDKKMIGMRTAFIKDGSLYCGCCGKAIKEREKEKTGDIIKCPSCRKKIKVSAARKNIRWTRGLQMYQEANDGRYIERQFDVEYVAAPGDKENIAITEMVRGFADAPGEMWDLRRYGQYRGVYGALQGFWDKKNWACFQNLRKKFTLYTSNLEDIGLEQVQISTIEALLQYGVELEWSYILRRCREHVFEAVCKSGIQGIAIQKAKGQDPQLPLESTMTKLNEMLGITRQQLRTLREMNGTYTSVFAMQDFKDVTREELAIFEKLGYSNYRLLSEIKKKGIPLTHVKTLLEKTAKMNASELMTYRDYLNMAAARAMDVTDEIVYRNKRWKEYHDRYAAEAAVRRQKEKNKKFPGIKRNYSKNKEIFEYASDDYIFIVPAKATDLVKEGQHQHNCVGASDHYMSNMATEESWIVFLRKKKSPKESFYTIEIDRDKVKQAYSAYNRKEDWDKVEPVINKWHREVKKRMKKLGVTA